MATTQVSADSPTGRLGGRNMAALLTGGTSWGVVGEKAQLRPRSRFARESDLAKSLVEEQDGAAARAVWPKPCRFAESFP